MRELHIKTYVKILILVSVGENLCGLGETIGVLLLSY